MKKTSKGWSENGAIIGSKGIWRNFLNRNRCQSMREGIVDCFQRWHLLGVHFLSAPHAELMPQDASFNSSIELERIKDHASYDLSPIKSLADAKLEREGAQYIFHIGQLHGTFDLEMTKEAFQHFNVPFERLHECQKQIEGILLFLKEKHGTRKVFVEHLTAHEAQWYQQIALDVQLNPVEAGHDLKQKAESGWSHKLDSTFETAEQSDELKAHLLLYAEHGLRDAPEGKEISEHPLIKGDMRYTWGAPYVLAAQNKIDLASAEDIDALHALSGDVSRLERNKVREAGVVKRLVEDGNTTSPSVLVYGANHNFSNPISEHGQNTGSNIGLIRINPHACKK